MGSVVEIHPLTRVEGHGSVKVYLENGRVERVELLLTESPRLFEALLVGKSYAEVPEIICRICSLCSTIHRVTALLAVENALGVEVNEVTRLTRELISYGGQIQSHALHLYCLVLPDLLELHGVTEVARAAPEMLKEGLAIKKAGNLIQETVGGRLIHPVNLVLGGLGRRLGEDELSRLREALWEALPLARRAPELFSAPPPLPRLSTPHYLALSQGSAPLFGDRLRSGTGEFFDVAQYRSYIEESVLPHTRAKQALIGGKQPTVGSLSRLNLGGTLSRLGREAYDACRDQIVGQDIWGNNAAQAVELVQAVEHSLELVETLTAIGKGGPVNVPVRPGKGKGSAASEAPRGTLIHSFTFDEAGICTSADVITPTSLNQGAMARDLLALARALEGAEESRICWALERLIRAYDPCISCAVHLLRR